MPSAVTRVQVFISYAHEDETEALYIRSVLDAAQWTKQASTIVDMAKSSASQLMNADSAGDKWKAGGKLAALAGWIIAGPGMVRGVDSTIQAQTWMDKDIPIGANWNEEIMKAITHSQVVLILTPNFLSGYVALECGIALGRQKTVMPIARSIGDLQPYNLQQYQALPWPNHSPDWEDTLRQALGKLL